MEYLADTVAIVRHLRSHPALGVEASRVLQETDAGLHRVYISAISLMAVMIASSGFRSRPKKRLGIDKLAEYYGIDIQIVYGR